jgi:hypothetical protein
MSEDGIALGCLRCFFMSNEIKVIFAGVDFEE